MAMPEIDEVKDAALKYDKKALAKMVQMGQMSNTTAMMAAMMRDRIVQSEMKPPAPPTVADEVFQPAQGLAAVPTDPRMFQGMADGGIVEESCFPGRHCPAMVAERLPQRFGQSSFWP